jgi:hypothetical protein
MEALNIRNRLGTWIISVRGTGKLRCILARTPRNFVLQRLGPMRSRKTMTEKVLRSALRSFQSERWEGYPDLTEDTIDIHGAAIPYTYSDQYPSPHDPPPSTSASPSADAPMPTTVSFSLPKKWSWK